MKKGFTLIELLAVIVILAVIALITTPIVLSIINDVKSSAELESARTLINLVNNYIVTEDLHGNSIKGEQTFIIINDVVYKSTNYVDRVEVDNFPHKGKLCNYCVIKINEDKKISILYEGAKQDIKKDYNSSELIKEELKQPREVVSLYNEIILFRDIYLKNNSMAYPKELRINGDSIYEITSTGQEQVIAKLYNSNGEGRLKILNSNNYLVTITTKDNIYEFTNDGEVTQSENVNSEYSGEILTLYNELMSSSERYLSKTTVNDEVYFEFNDGTINKVDKYGNTTQDSNMILSSRAVGSGELKINSSNQISIVIYDTDENIKVDYGSNELYSEPIKYSRDGLTLVKNLSRLELVAEEYSGSSGSTSDWLVFYYIRRLKYNSTIYDIVTGTDDNFITYVNTNAPNLNTYFKNKSTYTINGHKIDLKHMAASLAGNLYDTSSIYHVLYEELEYDCVVSWAGDLHTLMEESILKTGVKEQYGNYLNATYNLMGKSGTSFSMEDVYADMDAWTLYYNIKENSNLSIGEIFDKYYSGESTRSYKNRFTSFINIMNTIAPQFNSSKVNFEGVTAHFTNTDKNWQTIDSLEITPTDAEQQEIANGFIKWIKEQAAKE